MAKKPSAGDLFYSVAFGKREEVTDEYGNTQGAFVEQFSQRAGYIHLRGGESVLAGRLEGKHTQIIRVRSTSQTRQIKSDWYAQDKRDLKYFAVRDVTPLLDRQFIDILVEAGVAL
ncbi:head-tail adaptor [Phyllobacterium ifriqiyense]|uniref:Head-tail adaptor n=1 Tax=Phyllobacterium ifriqiyense TaxID=314238 RepID=A0ABU0S898_9HYPH|nr:head-tail adaptor protein [Phyllobacterium ifriqiyense]MDQ0996881.1 head-tail adaptor [Phyllobacterium ifriqiyense]